MSTTNNRITNETEHCLDFAKNVLSFLGEFVRAADQKAAFLLLASTALLGWLTTQTAAGWKFLVWIGAMVFVGISAILAVWSVKPRQHRFNTGLIAWNGILKTGGSSQYHDLTSTLNDGGLKEITDYSFYLAGILRTKYRVLSGAVSAFILGGAMTVVLLIAGVRAQPKAQSAQSSPCGIKAELRGLKILSAWNPNLVELDYFVTNRAAQDYALPEKFSAMKVTSDRVLHADTGNIEVPSESFFPRNHTVEFAVWVDIGKLVEHSPTDNEKTELQKQLEGTEAYILFDDKGQCEIELPVRSR